MSASTALVTVPSRLVVRPSRLAAFTALAMAATVLASSPVAAAPATPYDHNLVRNPGAEADIGGDGTSGVAPAHWQPNSPFTVVVYGTPNFPTKAESRRIDGGKNFFSCGPGSSSYAKQGITIHGRQAAIDGGHVKAALSVLVAGYGKQGDRGRATLDFVDNELIIGTIHTSWVSATHGRFVLKSKARRVPTGTDSLSVTLQGQRDAVNGGAYCDAEFDNVKVVLKHV